MISIKYNLRIILVKTDLLLLLVAALERGSLLVRDVAQSPAKPPAPRPSWWALQQKIFQIIFHMYATTYVYRMKFWRVLDD